MVWQDKLAGASQRYNSFVVLQLARKTAIAVVLACCKPIPANCVGSPAYSQRSTFFNNGAQQYGNTFADSNKGSVV